MLTLFRPTAPVASPTVTTFEAPDAYSISEAWWSGFALGADGFRLDVPADLPAELVASFTAGHWSGFDNFETELLSAAAAAGKFDPTTQDAAEWLGFTLGADGIDAELPTPDDAERAAFDRGLNAGDDYLWQVDPAFASYLKERAERAGMDDQADPAQTLHDNEIAEAGGWYRAKLTRGGVA